MQNKYEATLRQHPNNPDKTYLIGYTFIDTPVEVDGRYDLQLPPDIMRVWEKFSYIDVEGEHVADMVFTGVSPQLTEIMKTAGDTPARRTLKRISILLKKDVFEGYKIIVQGKGKITKVTLYNRQDKGLDPDFDDGPYSVLGADKPILTVKLTVDAAKKRSINGVSAFDRTKYMRVYSEPLREGPIVSQAIADKGFLPGRQQFKFDESLEIGYVPGQPQLKEDPERPGYADPVFFKNYRHEDFTAGTEAGLGAYKDIGNFYPQDFKFAMCFDNWPSFMRPRHVKIRNQRGTPGNYEAAADLAAMVLEKQVELSGRTATWWEVKNESTVPSEWMWHSAQDKYDSWGMLADFHNTMGRVIKKRVANVKVGGPASAFMMYDSADFGLARKQLEFMDHTKQNLDFYSHHFYENKGLISGDHLDRSYIHGRMRSILDLTFNHMYNTDNFKPLLITEFGVVHDGPRDIDHWMVMKSYGSFMVQLMNQPDRIDMAVPFLMPLVWWYKGWDTGLFEYLPDDVHIQPTLQMNYLDFWKDYKGHRIYSVDDNKSVHTHSLVDGDTVYIAINNINTQRVSVDLDARFGDAKIVSAEYSRLFLDQGALRYTKTDVKDRLHDLPLSVDETAMLTVKLSQPVLTTSAVDERMFFSDKELQETGRNVMFIMNTETNNLERALVRVGLGRLGGFSEDMTVCVNGFNVTASLRDTFNANNGLYYGNVELEIPVEHIKTMNEITVCVPETGGHIASVVMVGTFALPLK